MDERDDDRARADAEEMAPAIDVDALDPAHRQLAQLAPPLSPLASPTSPEAAPVTRARSLEELVPELVRRIAWTGDGRKGTVRLELGAGRYAGANVLVHADGGRVRVELGGLPEGELAALRERVEGRLARSGLDVESVT